MEEQKNSGVGSSCPVCGNPVAPEELAPHALTHENGMEMGGGENHENVPPPPMPPMNEDMMGVPSPQEMPPKEPPAAPTV